eukprot:gene3852-2472_t
MGDASIIGPIGIKPVGSQQSQRGSTQSQPGGDRSFSIRALLSWFPALRASVPDPAPLTIFYALELTKHVGGELRHRYYFGGATSRLGADGKEQRPYDLWRAARGEQPWATVDQPPADLRRWCGDGDDGGWRGSGREPYVAVGCVAGTESFAVLMVRAMLGGGRAGCVL